MIFTTLALLCCKCPLVCSCIYMLDGWSPLSVSERARNSEIVIGGQALSTFKNLLHPTYSARFLVQVAFKGRNSFSNLSRENFSERKGKGIVANISNFGDRSLCYSEVKRSEHYLLFLTTFRGSLSARYDDLFGAVVPWSGDNEMIIYRALGTKWGDWSQCSRTCGGGHEMRRRQITKDRPISDGDEIQYRSCNFFSCQASRSLPQLDNKNSKMKNLVIESKINFAKFLCLLSTDRMDEMKMKMRFSTDENVLHVRVEKHLRPGNGTGQLLRQRRTFSSGEKSAAGSDVRRMTLVHLSVHRKSSTGDERVTRNATTTRGRNPRVVRILTEGSASRLAVGIAPSQIKLFVDCALRGRLKISRAGGFEGTELPSGEVSFKAVLRPLDHKTAKPQIIIVNDPTFAQCSPRPRNFLRENTEDQIGRRIANDRKPKNEKCSREMSCQACCQSFVRSFLVKRRFQIFNETVRLKTTENSLINKSVEDIYLPAISIEFARKSI